ncbi:unnamed protein product, partial [Amoebophrya sp. A25]
GASPERAVALEDVASQSSLGQQETFLPSPEEATFEYHPDSAFLDLARKRGFFNNNVGDQVGTEVLRVVNRTRSLSPLSTSRSAVGTTTKNTGTSGARSGSSGSRPSSTRGQTTTPAKVKRKSAAANTRKAGTSTVEESVDDETSVEVAEEDLLMVACVQTGLMFEVQLY